MINNLVLVINGGHDTGVLKYNFEANNFQVIFVSDEHEALQMAQDVQPQMILIDLDENPTTQWTIMKTYTSEVGIPTMALGGNHEMMCRPFISLFDGFLEKPFGHGAVRELVTTFLN